jgi:alpha-L-fucosidase
MKKTYLFISICLVAFLGFSSLAWGGPASAQGLKNERTQWFQDAKFGLFIHWGVYSMLGREEWARQLCQIPLSEYQYYADHFNPVLYNPDEWVRLAKDAGVKYIVITSKHHDGFCMFDTKYTNYNIMHSEFGKDALGMLVEACKKNQMPIGFYYSIMDWNHPDYLPRRTWETGRPTRDADFSRYMDYAINQIQELMTKYDPAILWFDGQWEHTNEEQRAPEIAEMLFKMKPNLLINDRLFKQEPGLGDFGTPENFVPTTGVRNADGTPRLWEACYTMNFNGWGYNRYETEFHSSSQLIRQLIEIASKGGNLLLNVGPMPDGTIQPEFAARLKRMGEWLKDNGEAIYGTSASVFDKLPFFGRCTVKGNKLYVHVMGWPEDKRILLPGLKTFLRKVYFLKNEKALDFRRTGRGIVISLPDRAPDPDATVIVVELQNPPDVARYEIRPSAGGRIELPVYLADLQSEMGQRAYLDYFYRTTMLTNWQNVNDYPSWEFFVERTGTYEVQASYASMWGGKSTFAVEIDDLEIPGTSQNSPSVYFPKTFTVGTTDLKEGKHALRFKIKSIANNQALRLEKVVLKPL